MLQAVCKAVRGVECIYLGDTARTPYGSKSGSVVARYARECAHFLAQFEIDLMVIACNTVSAVALEGLKAEHPCPVIGTIEPAVQTALAERGPGPIGVIGTRATISSGVYASRINQLMPDLEVVSQACPLFVPLVEEGLFSGGIVAQAIEMYLRPFKEKNITTLILACTHYPLLHDAIDSYFSSQVRIVECSQAIAADVRSRAALQPVKDGTEERVQYFVTDEVSRFNALASLLLDRAPVRAVKVENFGG